MINFLTFFGGFLSLTVGTYIFLKDSRNQLNIAFFLMNLAVGFVGLTYPIDISLLKDSPDTVLNLQKITWSFVLSISTIYFYICAVIANPKILEKRLVKISLYLPLLLGILYIIFSSTSLFFPEFPEKQGPHMLNLDFFRFYMVFYYVPLLLLGTLLLVKKYYETKIAREKNLIKYFFWALMVPIGPGTLMTIIPLLFGYLDNNLRSMPWLLFGLGNFIIAIGIARYRIFIDFRDILDNVFKTLVDLIIITDEKGVINLVNQATLKELNYKEGELVGQNISGIIREGKSEWERIYQKMKTRDIVSGQEIYFLNKENTPYPFLLDFSKIKVKERMAGVIFIGKEIKGVVDYRTKLEEEVKDRTEELEDERASLEIKVRARTKELEELNKTLDDKVKERTHELETAKEELQKKLTELEKWYQLTVGRELRMKELKDEVEKLKKELGK